MIGKLKGIIDALGDDFVILDVQGVGYVVHSSARTLQNLPSIGEAASLWIETHMREDMIRLYGFPDETDRDWFRLLQSVQGVGAKVALGILSVLDARLLNQAVLTGDKAMVARGPGVGPKLAARIVAELKDKAPAVAGGSGSLPLAASLGESAPDAARDAVSALVNLGYAQLQAASAVATALKEAGEEPQTKTLIRLGLRELSR